MKISKYNYGVNNVISTMIEYGNHTSFSPYQVIIVYNTPVYVSGNAVLDRDIVGRWTPNQ